MFSDTENGCIFSVKVRTSRPKTRILDVSDRFVTVELRSEPKENRANLELASFLGKVLGREVRIVSGHKTKMKKVFVYGMKSKECALRLLEFKDN